MTSLHLDRPQLQRGVAEGGRVVLGPPGQPGVLLGAGGPPQVGPHHVVGVELVDWPPVVGLTHPEGVELSWLTGTHLLLEDNTTRAGVDLDVGLQELGRV